MRIRALDTNTARLSDITNGCLRGRFLSLVSAAKLLYHKRSVRVGFSDGRAFLDVSVWRDELFEAGLRDLDKVGKIMERLMVHYSASENGAGTVIDLDNIYSSIDQTQNWQTLSRKRWNRLIRKNSVRRAGADGNGAIQVRPTLTELKYPLAITVSDIELNQRGLTDVREDLRHYVESDSPLSTEVIRPLLDRLKRHLNVYSQSFVVVHLMTMLADRVEKQLLHRDKEALVPVYVALAEYFEVQKNFDRAAFALGQAIKILGDDRAMDLGVRAVRDFVTAGKPKDAMFACFQVVEMLSRPEDKQAVWHGTISLFVDADMKSEAANAAWQAGSSTADKAGAGRFFIEAAGLFKQLNIYHRAADALDKAARLTEDYPTIKAYYRRAAELYLRAGMKREANVTFINAAQFVEGVDGEKPHENSEFVELIARANACQPRRPGRREVDLESLED